MFNEILSKFGLTLEDLRPEERDTFRGWIEILDTKEVTVSSIQNMVTTLKTGVEQELSKLLIVDEESKERDHRLKARLQELIFLDVYLQSPQKAQQFIEKQLEQLAKAKQKG